MVAAKNWDGTDFPGEAYDAWKTTETWSSEDDPFFGELDIRYEPDPTDYDPDKEEDDA